MAQATANSLNKELSSGELLGKQALGMTTSTTSPATTANTTMERPGAQAAAVSGLLLGLLASVSYAMFRHRRDSGHGGDSVAENRPGRTAATLSALRQKTSDLLRPSQQPPAQPQVQAQPPYQYQQLPAPYQAPVSPEVSGIQDPGAMAPQAAPASMPSPGSAPMLPASTSTPAPTSQPTASSAPAPAFPTPQSPQQTTGPGPRTDADPGLPGAHHVVNALPHLHECGTAVVGLGSLGLRSVLGAALRPGSRPDPRTQLHLGHYLRHAAPAGRPARAGRLGWDHLGRDHLIPVGPRGHRHLPTRATTSPAAHPRRPDGAGLPVDRGSALYSRPGLREPPFPGRTRRPHSPQHRPAHRADRLGLLRVLSLARLLRPLGRALLRAPSGTDADRGILLRQLPRRHADHRAPARLGAHLELRAERAHSAAHHLAVGGPPGVIGRLAGRVLLAHDHEPASGPADLLGSRARGCHRGLTRRGTHAGLGP